MGWTVQVRAEVPKPSADSGWGEPCGLGCLLPGAAEVRRGFTGEPELGVGGDDQPRPALAGLRGAEFRAGPAQGLLHQPEEMLDVEPAQERLPADVDVLATQTSGRRPQPEGLRVSTTGQAVDLEADQRALNDGE